METLEPLCVAGGRSNAAAAVQNRMAGREKVHRLPHDPATPLLGLHPKELKAGTHTDTVHRYSQQFYAQSQEVETTQIPGDEGEPQCSMYKQWSIIQT